MAGLERKGANQTKGGPVPVTTIENTGDLQQYAEAYDRIKRDPRQPGPLDFVLAASTLAAVFVAGITSLILVMAPDEYPVDPGRVLLVMASIGTIAGSVLAMGYFLNRAQRGRHVAVMEKLDRIRCGCDGMTVVRRPLVEANGRTLSPSEYYKVYNDALKDLGDLEDGEGSPTGS